MSVLAQKHILLIGALGGGGWYLSPSGFNLYRVGSGDSLEALAGRYLGDAGRAREIWSMQSSTWQADHGNNMDNLRVGDELLMPQQAVDAAKAAGDASGGRGAAPSKLSSGKTLDNGTDVLVPHGGGGGGGLSIVPTPVPIRPTPATPSTPVAPSAPSAGLSTVAKLAIGGVAIVAAGGAVAYGVHHFKKPRRSNPSRRRHARRVNGTVGGIDAHRIHINRGGYDFKGRYWGVGQPLYYVSKRDGGGDAYVRANSAKEARAKANLR